MKRRASPRPVPENRLLTDTGPLVALADKDDVNHVRAQSQLKLLSREPLLTVWPCMTEAVYLLGREGGYPAQAELLKFWTAGVIRLWEPDRNQAKTLERRIVELMAAYRDTPCDFADATLVAVAEILNVRRIFTFDSHFYAYRTANGDALEVISGKN